MKEKKSLPAPFVDLEDYLGWVLPTETLRRQKRETCNLKEITEFYEAVLPQVQRIFDHFRAAEKSAGGADMVDIETKTLFTLMLAFSEASLSVEVHKSPVVPDGMPGDIWKPEHETAGWKKKPRSILSPRMVASA